MIQFTVYGVPQTKGSAKGFAIKNKVTGKARVIITNDNSKNRPWSETVSAMAQQHRTSECPYLGAIVLQLIFTLPIPQSLPKRRSSLAMKRPDIDKCTRSILDALKSVVYRDDSQVVGLFVVKRYGPKPGVLVTVEHLTIEHDEIARYAYCPPGVVLSTTKEVVS